MMWKIKRAAAGAFCGAAFALLASGNQTAAHAQVPYKITRTSLAKTASFTVTQTLAPKGSDKLVRVYKIEVSGNNARLDYDDPSIGAVRYLANNKGVFFYIPANKSAVKQTPQGGVEGALKFAFAQVNDQLAHAKKIKTETVSGQATTVYKDAQTGTLVYLGQSPGFTLPVKTVVSNVGGTSTLLVSNIKLNVPVDAKRFALPSGTQMMDSGSSPAGAGLPAGVGGGVR